MRNGLRVGRKLRWSSRSIGVATTNTDHTAALAIGHLSRPLRPGEVRQEGNRSTQESARLSHCEWSEEPRQVTVTPAEGQLETRIAPERVFASFVTVGLFA